MAATIAIVVVIAAIVGSGVARLAGLGASAPTLVIGSAAFVSPDEGWITLGDPGSSQAATFKTTNGGRTWHKQLDFPLGSTGSRFGVLGTSMQFVDTTHGFTYTAQGTVPNPKRQVLYRTVDGGLHWVPVLLPKVSAGGLVTFNFSSPKSGLLLVIRGGLTKGESATMFGTNDGGNSWHTVVNSTPVVLPGGLFIPAFQNAVRQSGSGRIAVLPLAPSLSTVINYFSVNGGKTWTGRAVPVPPVRRPSQALLSVQQLPGVSEISGVAYDPLAAAAYLRGREIHGSSQYFVYRLNKTGASIGAPVKIPLTYDWAAHSDPFTNTDPASAFVGPGVWAFATEHKFILTATGGHSWTTLPSPLDSRFRPGGLRFFDQYSGVIWGYGRRAGALKSTLLQTSDGGHTWSRITLPSHL